MSGSDSWFVQTGFGTVLGPMPIDTLRSMVRTQELLPTDMVRRGPNDDWQAATDIPGLFATTIREQSAAVNVEPAKPAAPAKHADAPVVAESVAPAADSPLKPVEVSIPDKQPVRSSDVASPSPPTVVAPVKPKTVVNRNAARPGPDWLRNVQRGPVVAAVCVVLLAAWWFWPRSPANIHPRLMAIWDELQVRRSNPDGAAEMEQFVVRANRELDQIIPWLQDHASPKQRELQLLLFVSRDSLRVMLKRPRDTGLPQEERLRILLRALQEFRENSESSRATAEAIAGQNRRESADDLDPENTGSALISAPTREPAESSNPATEP